MALEYFANLVPDYTQEVPIVSDKSLETMRRLLFMFKTAINGKPVLLIEAVTGDNVAISPEFESEFGWTIEEFMEISLEEFFHEDSWAVAQVHADNQLAAPFIASCYGKGGGRDWYKVQGLTVEFDDWRWRMLSFVKIED